MKSQIKSQFNSIKRVCGNIALAVCFFAKTRDINLSWELANIHNLVVGLTPVQITRWNVVTSAFYKYIQHGSERSERLKRRYLIQILPCDTDVYDDVKLNKDYGTRSESCRRLTVKVSHELKRFVRDLIPLPFALLLVLLWIPLNSLLRVKLRVTREEASQLIVSWWELLNGYLSEGHEYTHHWVFAYGEDIDTRYWMTHLRHSMLFVPYACREKLVTDFKRQRKLYLKLNADYRREIQARNEIVSS